MEEEEEPEVVVPSLRVHPACTAALLGFADEAAAAGVPALGWLVGLRDAHSFASPSLALLFAARQQADLSPAADKGAPH